MCSSSRFANTVGGLVAVALMLLSSVLVAQGRRGRELPRMDLPQLEARGTVEAMVAPNVIRILSDSNQAWFLRVSPQTRIEITGKAKPDMLSPGQNVKFVAKVNPKFGRVEEPVDKVTLFAPSVLDPLGALPEEEAVAAAAAFAAAKREGAGPAPKIGLQPGFGAHAELGHAPGMAAGAHPGFGARHGPGAGKAGGKTRAAASDSFEIKGRISSIKAGKVTLSVPNPYFKSTLRFDLAEEVDVSVQMEGTAAQCPLIARQGDKVEARGRQVAENGGDVSEIKITLTEPLTTETQKKPRAKIATTGRTKKSEESQEPAEDKDGAREPVKDRPKAASKEEPSEEPSDEADVPAKGKKAAPRKTEGT